VGNLSILYLIYLSKFIQLYIFNKEIIEVGYYCKSTLYGKLKKITKINTIDKIRFVITLRLISMQKPLQQKEEILDKKSNRFALIINSNSK
jgi:hypothetical protein